MRIRLRKRLLKKYKKSAALEKKVQQIFYLPVLFVYNPVIKGLIPLSAA